MAHWYSYMNASTEEERIIDGETFESKYKQCTKTNHDKFIDIDKLCLKSLPEEYRENEMLYCIFLLATLTGRIHVSNIPSSDRRDHSKSIAKIRGTGFVQKIRTLNYSKCPCQKCEGREYKQYAILTVTTVNHVMGDNAPAGNAVMLLETPEMSLTIHGHKISKTDQDEDREKDWCAVEFVSHEIDKVKTLETSLENFKRVQAELYEKYKDRDNVNLVVITGYPHGLEKKVSFGKVVGPKEILKEVRADQEWCRYQYDAVTCPGSSGSPVFILGQPVCGFGYWFGHQHNHSKGAKLDHNELREVSQKNVSSIGVEMK